MSAEDWYQRHLGGGRAAPPPPASGSPYYYPQAQQAPQYYQQPPPQEAYYADPTQQALAAIGVGTPGARNPWAPVPPSPVDTSRIPKGAITPENFLTMAQFWRGSQGQKEAQHCPRCDGVLFRRFEGRREAAPMCTDCGWNGLWDQGEHAHTAA